MNLLDKGTFKGYFKKVKGEISMGKIEYRYNEQDNKEREKSTLVTISRKEYERLLENAFKKKQFENQLIEIEKENELLQATVESFLLSDEKEKKQLKERFLMHGKESHKIRKQIIGKNKSQGIKDKWSKLVGKKTNE